MLDSDTIVKKNWLLVLCSLYAKQMDKPNILLSGFNSLRKKNLKETADYCQKADIGGVSLFFSTDLYKKLFLPLQRSWDELLVLRMSHRGYRILATKPSVVQHTGWQGTFSRGYFLVIRLRILVRFQGSISIFIMLWNFRFSVTRRKLGRLRKQLLGG